MKNKKTASVILIILLTAFYVFAEVELTEFSFAPEVGFLNGKIVENVWYVQVSSTDNTLTFKPTTKMSRLDWKLENSFFFGAATDFTFNDKYTVSFSFKNAISGDSGIMEDYDWLKVSNPDYLSRYSKHTNHINSFTQVDFYIKRLFYLGQKKLISIAPRFGFETQNVSLTGTGGWRTYDTEDWEKIYFENSPVISYSQSFFAPVLGFDSDFNFLQYFETQVNLSAVWAKKLDCYDLHIIRNALFNDRIEDAWKLNAELGLFYKLNKNNRFGFRGTVSYAPDSYGFTYFSAESNTPDKTSIGGTSRFLWSYSFVYKIIF